MPGRKTAFLSQEQFDIIRSQYSRFNEPWLKEELEELKSMAAENVPFDQMSQQLQRTPSSIRMKLKALGLYTPKSMMPRWSEEDDALIIQMYDQGISFEDMAAHFNRSRNAIVARLVNLRVKLFENV